MNKKDNSVYKETIQQREEITKNRNLGNEKYNKSNKKLSTKSY